MSDARSIALSAHEQAKKAAALEAAHEEAIKEDRRRQEIARHTKAFEAALPILNEWFPGVEWIWWVDGDYSNDTIVTDASENWPPSFKLRVDRLLIDMNEPSAGCRSVIEVGDYRRDTSLPGHIYFAGSKVKGPADIGRYLQAQEDRKVEQLGRLTD